ncbi:hypothetical protein QR680_015355 [Steinernema hermaphroditum]|uniref:Carboxypeptidase n=1 Tax=Steinernema hermaphroditum TaxID=289476 RepID=A0AA39H7E4_9BILA|nr:hypothetical protein QR680_015355 [Steinernema hermaphroditum]
MCCWVEWIYLLVVAIGVVAAAPSNDKIGKLPDLDFTPNFDQYSGYLTAGPTKRHFYWFTESERNPAADPIILWLNGGPGCSSLQGLLTEMGPYRVKEYGKKVVRNPYAWNKIANVVYMESPAGVGYSYNTDGKTNYTDDEVANDNHNALIHFFSDKFPEYKYNDFYIMGESYAGTYIPMLASRLINDKVNFPKFKGMAVGNGCLNDRLLFNSLIQFSYNHGFIDENYFRSAVKKCCPAGSAECDWYSYSLQNATAKCNQEANYLNMANYNTGLDPYFLYFTCYSDSPAMPSALKSTMRHFIARKFGHNVETLPATEAACSHHNDDILWLNRKDVRKAIHIPDDLPIYTSCNYKISQNYVTQYTDMTPFVKRAVDARLKILFFNGDVDSVCNVMHNAQFLADLGLPLVKSSAPWNDQSELPMTAGFYTKYKGLDFLTVRGAGHFAASEAEKPRETLQMINNFLFNKEYSTPFSG